MPVFPVATLSWQQSSWHPSLGGDSAGMGISFLDSLSQEINPPFWSTISVTPDHVWTLRSIMTSVPDGTEGIRLYMKMVRNRGTNNDGYIDNIALSIDGTPITIVNPGAELDPTTGWTSTTGNLGRRAGDPAPYAGTYYFYGLFYAVVQAQQDIAGSFGYTAPCVGHVHLL